MSLAATSLPCCRIGSSVAWLLQLVRQVAESSDMRSCVHESCARYACLALGTADCHRQANTIAGLIA